MSFKKNIFLILVMVVVFSCKKSNQDPRDQIAILHSSMTPQDEAIQIIEESRDINDPLTEEAYSDKEVLAGESAAVNEVTPSHISDGVVPDSISMTEPKGTLTPNEIKNYISRGRFNKILAYEVDTSSSLAKYYYGITYYCLAKLYSPGTSKRNSYAQKAVSILKEAAVDTGSRELKAKSILWHGISMLVLQSKKYSTAALLKPFRFIEKNLYNTRCYNDALFYSSQIYRIRGDYNASEDYLDRLNDTRSSDKIYDVRYSKWVRPQLAYSHYMTKLNKKPLRSYSRPVDSLARKVEQIHNEIVGSSDSTEDIDSFTEENSTISDSSEKSEVDSDIETADQDSAADEDMLSGDSEAQSDALDDALGGDSTSSEVSETDKVVSSAENALEESTEEIGVNDNKSSDLDSDNGDVEKADDESVGDVDQNNDTDEEDEYEEDDDDFSL